MGYIKLPVQVVGCSVFFCFFLTGIPANTHSYYFFLQESSLSEVNLSFTIHLDTDEITMWDTVKPLY